MRNFIDLIESDHIHPHARGEDEYFNILFGAFSSNVDEAKRLIASGEIKANTRPYSVKFLAQKMFKAKEEDFGSRDFKSPTTIQMFDAPVHRPAMLSIPLEKMDEPLLFIQWDAEKSRLSSGDTRPGPSGSYYLMIDGNHRLIRKYLEGDEGEAQCQFITDWNDICKFTYDRKGNKLTPIEE